MPYTHNPYLPRLRMEAVNKVRFENWSMRQTARYFGVQPSTVSRWYSKGRYLSSNSRVISTQSSCPYKHPKELSFEMVDKIIQYRQRYRRCAEVIHWHLMKDGYIVSLSSIKRTLKRNHLTYPSPWKKWHKYISRPIPDNPGKLVEIDTIVDGAPEDRLYIYTLLDVRSRWAYAEPSLYARAGRSALALRHAQNKSPFRFQTIQSDHGSEFSKYFTKRCVEMNIIHRHSRIRTPTDNAHIERFNRTLQDECLSRVPRQMSVYQKEISEYIYYYNHERPHMSLGMQTPYQVLRRS